MTIGIKDEKFNYSFGYYEGNKWLSEDKIVLMRSEHPKMNRAIEKDSITELVVYDISNGSITRVAENVNAFTDFLVYGSLIYYVKGSELRVINLDTCEEKLLFRRLGIGSPHITKDGKYISLFSCRPELSEFFRVDTETGESVKLFGKAFSEPYPYANHGMICPTDGDVLFFAHEGDTTKISDRLWIYDKRKDLSYNIAIQKTDENGIPEDCFGHESWAHDGKGIYFVKYRESKTKSGICYADINTGRHQLLFSGYDYWHVCASPSGNYLLADTRNLGGERSGVVMIDLNTKEERLIATPKTNFSHPCHPHPSLSYDDSKLIYHSLNEYGKCSVNICVL